MLTALGLQTLPYRVYPPTGHQGVGLWVALLQGLSRSGYKD